jgi:hypothetical protein
VNADVQWAGSSDRRATAITAATKATTEDPKSTAEPIAATREPEPLVRGEGMYRAEVAPVEREHRIGPVLGR